jgi:hypothetical protein
MSDPLSMLERQRAETFAAMQALGDMRRGSIVERYRPCGKSPCCCEAPNHPGHGPYYSFTTKVDGRTRTRQLQPGPALAKVRREIAAFREFQTLSQHLVQISEALCEARPVPPAVSPVEAVKKKSHRPSRKRSRGK